MSRNVAQVSTAERMLLTVYLGCWGGGGGLCVCTQIVSLKALCSVTFIQNSWPITLKEESVTLKIPLDHNSPPQILPIAGGG